MSGHGRALSMPLAGALMRVASEVWTRRSAFDVTLQVRHDLSPGRRGARIHAVFRAPSAMRKAQPGGAAAARNDFEQHLRADPFSGPSDAGPERARARSEFVDPHAEDHRMVEKTKFGDGSDLVGSAGVVGPPTSDAVAGCDRFVNPRGRRLQNQLLTYIGHRNALR